MPTNLPAVFGPVASRRLGLSLGIDLLDFKTCSLNCVYCELGLTTNLTSQRERFRSYRQVLDQAEQRLAELVTPPDCLTLAGSGEPTLHLDLGLTLAGMHSLSSTKKVVLTNSTLLHLPEVRRDLLQADIIVPSLDALTPEIFDRINRPAVGIDPAAILEGLIRLRQEFAGAIWLEILLVKGINDQTAELDKLRQAALLIKPDLVQLNTIVRPPACADFAPLPSSSLRAIAASFDLPTQVIESSLAAPGQDQAALAEVIIQTTNLRPCTLPDLAQISGLTPSQLKILLNGLIKQGRLESTDFDGRRYYRGRRPV